MHRGSSVKVAVELYSKINHPPHCIYYDSFVTTIWIGMKMHFRIAAILGLRSSGAAKSRFDGADLRAVL